MEQSSCCLLHGRTLQPHTRILHDTTTVHQLIVCFLAQNNNREAGNQGRQACRILCAGPLPAPPDLHMLSLCEQQHDIWQLSEACERPHLHLGLGLSTFGYCSLSVMAQLVLSPGKLMV